MGKLTKSRVLWGGVGLCGAPRGEDGVENFHRHVGPSENGVRQNHAGGHGDPILRTHLAPPHPIAISNSN